MSELTVESFASVIKTCWCRETSLYPRDWSKHNPALGQSLVTSLLARETLGGAIVKGLVKGVVHYWNYIVPVGEVDFTVSQFGGTAQSRVVQATSSFQRAGYEDFTEATDVYFYAPDYRGTWRAADDPTLLPRYTILRTQFDRLLQNPIAAADSPSVEPTVPVDNEAIIDAGRRLVQAVLALHQIKGCTDGDGSWRAIREHEYRNLYKLVRHDSDIRHYFGQCCDRDHNRDGNCDVHSSPGVMRRQALPEAVTKCPSACACHAPKHGGHEECGTQTNIHHEPCCGNPPVQQVAKSAQCCERDYNYDGNCDLHSSPGVMRMRFAR